ncbi:MAG: M15 family metallopeptidase [Bacilli bacterium]|nr:M15 family metallopeptidase [Bacilli bacterium]
MKKRHKMLLQIVVFGFIILGIYFVWNRNNNNNSKLPNIKYSNEAITIMKEQNILKEIEQKDYSKTIEIMLLNHDLKHKYLNAYYEIKEQERTDFTKLVNLFLDKNYTPAEINDILEYLNDKNLNQLKEMEYVNLQEYVKISNMEVDKIERYKSYQVANQTNAQDAVTKVNIGLDQEFYSEISTIKNPNSYTVLLNKYRGLPKDYAPNDLTSLSINPNYKLRAKAAEAYEQLQSAALLDNVKFFPFSAYRTEQYQTRLYNNYVNRDGKKAADTYSARPRHSEHETGLAVDIRSNGLSDNLTDNDYKWMLNNSYKYGFIVRYPKGSMPITGYIEEPWHLRYIGVDIATDIHEKNITFDEYYDLYLKDKEKMA